MSFKKINFPNADGEQLAAIIDFPDNSKPVAFALFAHLFTGNKNFNAVRNISRALTSNGIAVMRFDFTGLGESEGEFADTNFSSNIEDLEAAAAFLKAEYTAPSIIIGHSLGGAAAIFASVKIESIKAVATIAAPSDPSHVSHLFAHGLDEINKNGKADVTIAGRSFTIRRQFLQDINERNLREIIRVMRDPILIFHSPHDEIVSIDNAAEIYEWAMHPKSFISLDGADHLLSDERDSQYVGSMIAAWATRYI